MARANLAWTRIGAWGIDWLILVGLSALFHWIGWLVGSVYWLLRDGLFDGQSVGKRLMGVRVVGADGQRATWSVSITRNILWVIPFINLAAALTGLYYLFQDPQGQHWGDRLAKSRVISSQPA